MTFDDIPPKLIANLEAAQEVAFRMVLTRSGEQWHIHTLIIDVFPEESRGSWPCYDYNYGYVTFIAGGIPGSVASKWLLSEKETVNAYTFQRPFQIEFERPLWHPSNISDDLPSIPWPHTRYNTTLSYEPRVDPFAPSPRRPRTGPFNWSGQTQAEPRSWPREEHPEFLIRIDCPFFADFKTAIFQLIYDVVDPNEIQQRKLAEAIIVRIAHTEAWFEHINLTPTQISIDVSGRSVFNTRLQIYGAPELQYDEKLTQASQVVSSLPRGIPQELWLVLSRDDQCIDYCYLNKRWSPFSSYQKNVSINSPDIRTRIQEILYQGEGQTVEFKKHISDDGGTAIKTVAAFANGEGGVILLGIDDKSGDIVGITESINRTKDTVIDLIRRKVVPEPEIRIESCDFNDKQVVAIYVEKGNSPPYGINPEKPEFYVRRGATTFPAKQEEIVALAQNSIQKSGTNHE